MDTGAVFAHEHSVGLDTEAVFGFVNALSVSGVLWQPVEDCFRDGLRGGYEITDAFGHINTVGGSDEGVGASSRRTGVIDAQSRFADHAHSGRTQPVAVLPVA